MQKTNEKIASRSEVAIVSLLSLSRTVAPPLWGTCCLASVSPNGCQIHRVGLAFMQSVIRENRGALPISPHGRARLDVVVLSGLAGIRPSEPQSRVGVGKPDRRGLTACRYVATTSTIRRSDEV